MAVPKRRKSKATRDHRRAQWMRSVAIPPVTLCGTCKEPKLPHRICANCGKYGDRQVIATEKSEA